MTHLARVRRSCASAPGPCKFYLSQSRRHQHERDSSTCRHPEGRFHHHVGRQTVIVEHRWTPLRRLGDLSYERVPGRSEPDLRLTVEQLVRAGGAPLRRWWQNLGGGRKRVHVRRCAWYTPVV